ncbi:prepilin-type N-terminal cleavage/methylation domain-containing protein [Alkaliphilus sp. B6464]|uniref:prepilin-type N-terminal cleavage/methylation domain-containing protein n=1 Tax=Alkaliphilus sp. B6464 TaxID=2731219 RepID=UPI001BA4F655|nr:prepilin-type N-terminal cleavage/methylation domain-containing protein [Alkaliphilus sp. B6464]QUH22127.1 prepilin-type N-terminal cleavage/methylation domain-containing protein [Alkaliphilus sp. B6464]
MKKMQRKGFTLVELIIVIVVIGLLAGMAAPKFMGVVRDARHANFVNDVDVLTTVATLVETQREQNDPVYGHDVSGVALDFSKNADLQDGLKAALADSGVQTADIDAKLAEVKIMPIDAAKYSESLGKKTKTADLSKFYVVTEGVLAGTIVYEGDETAEKNGVVDGQGNEFFGLEIVKKAQ